MPAFARQVAEVSTRVIGFAFAVNTAVIVGLQFFVLGRITGRRRTRVFMVMSTLWGCPGWCSGSAGLVPGTLAASAAVLVFMALFALGETMLQPTVPCITNDLALDHLRGRYNAVSAGAQRDHPRARGGGPVAGAPAGRRLHRHARRRCAVMVRLALLLERRITAEVKWPERRRHPRPTRPRRPGPVVSPCPARSRPQPTARPHCPDHCWPGSRTIRPEPELNASAGQVIGSTAMPRILTRRLGLAGEHLEPVEGLVSPDRDVRRPARRRGRSSAVGPALDVSVGGVERELVQARVARRKSRPPSAAGARPVISRSSTSTCSFAGMVRTSRRAGCRRWRCRVGSAAEGHRASPMLVAVRRTDRPEPERAYVREVEVPGQPGCGCSRWPTVTSASVRSMRPTGPPRQAVAGVATCRLGQRVRKSLPSPGVQSRIRLGHGIRSWPRPDLHCSSAG